MTRTVADKLAALEAKRERFEQQQAAERAILEALPDDLPAPTISNTRCNFFGTPGAFLSWHAPYFGETGPSGSEILATLEAHGFEPLPATLCRWDYYRPNPEPGAAEDIPETKRPMPALLYTLQDATPIAPLWIIPFQHGHGDPKARAYYRHAGRIYQVTVAAPRAVGVYARRVESRGSWRYERGTARLIIPDAWHAIRTESGEAVAGVSSGSGAWVDTEQGISGAIYFEPYTEQREFPLTPAELLAILEATA